MSDQYNHLIEMVLLSTHNIMYETECQTVKIRLWLFIRAFDEDLVCKIILIILKAPPPLVSADVCSKAVILYPLFVSALIVYGVSVLGQFCGVLLMSFLV